MELKDLFSLATLFVTVGLAVYTGRFRAQVEKDLKRMETRIHARKWAIDAKAKALTDYWKAINFIPEVFAQVAQRPDPDALQKFRNEVSLRLYYAYMTLKLHYDQFDALNADYSRNTRKFFEENKRLLSPDTFREEEFGLLLDQYGLIRIAEKVGSLCRQELNRLYEGKVLKSPCRDAEPEAKCIWARLCKMLCG